MTPEKVAVLVITGVIAILLSITLMGSADSSMKETPRGQSGSTVRRTEKDETETFNFRDANRGGYATEERKEPEPKPRAQSRSGTVQKDPSPGAQVSVPAAKPKTYSVQPGDTFQKIAKKLYGRSSRAEDLIAANGNIDPRKLRVGMQIVVPNLPDAKSGASKSPTDSGGQWHLVSKGEVLQSIAKDRYGKSSEWKRILEANRDVLKRPEDLRIGMRLRIP